MNNNILKFIASLTLFTGSFILMLLNAWEGSPDGLTQTIFFITFAFGAIASFKTLPVAAKAKKKIGLEEL